MDTNLLLIGFFIKNALAIFLFVFLILKIVPPEWAGFHKYNNNDEQQGRANKMSILRFIIDGVIDGILSPISIHILTLFSFKNMITVLIFFVVGFDIFIRHQISAAVVTLIGIGIIALYLENLIDTGKKIEFFGIIKWEKKD